MFVCMMGAILVNNCCLASDREGVQISLAILQSPYFLPLVLLPILYQQSEIERVQYNNVGKKTLSWQQRFFTKGNTPL
jgi:hypothetical protein